MFNQKYTANAGYASTGTTKLPAADTQSASLTLFFFFAMFMPIYSIGPRDMNSRRFQRWSAWF